MPSLMKSWDDSDSSVGFGHVEATANLRRVHAESAKEHGGGVRWMEHEYLGQHLLRRDLDPATVRL